MEIAEREAIVGAGRALPHAGLSALQAWKTSKASKSALRDPRKTRTRLIRDRTTGSIQWLIITQDQEKDKRRFIQKLGAPGGVEPPTNGLGNRSSIHLS